MQQGQVFPLNSGDGGVTQWAFRYRTGGRGSKRVQRGGFATEQAAVEALERALERIRRERGLVETPTLREFVDVYLAQHGGEPETVEKLGWLLAKSVAVFGDRRLSQLRSPEIAAWRMTVPYGHRFEATQALRQVLNRAVEWGLIDINPAKKGVDNQQRRRVEKRPFESWKELEAVAGKVGGRCGPLVVFAAATGLRPGEWLALEWRDIDREQRVVYVRRSYRNGRIKYPKTDASMRAVPLQARALAALDAIPEEGRGELVFPSSEGGYFDLHNFRNRYRQPAQVEAGSRPPGGSTISATRSRPSRFVPAFPPSTSLATWYEPDNDRPPLRSPRPGRTRARDQAPRRAQPAEENGPTSTPWTPGGRRRSPPSPTSTT